MRLADWVVSCSLEINSGCLRYLAESQVRGASAVCAEPEDAGIDTQAIYTESLLARDSRKILSHWQLLNEALQVDEVQEHVAALGLVVDKLTRDPAPMRLALRLASQAPEDEQAQLMLKLGRALPKKAGPDWTSLNELFAHDSALWRRNDLFASVDDGLLSRRIGRSYRSAYKVFKRLPDEDWSDEKVSAEDNETLARLAHHAQLASHHMELLRSTLSDKQKHQLWYLDKLANALRMRQSLQELSAATREKVFVEKRAAKQARRYLAGQESKVNKRIRRLFSGTFTTKPKKFTRRIEASITELGLANVATVRGDSRPRARVAEVSVDETMPDSSEARLK